MRDERLEFKGTTRFEVLSRLGQGGMGVVYAAYDRERQTDVAVKTLASPEPANIRRLINEFRALQDMDHPNLVAMGELFEEQGHWFFSMELIDGVDFITHVRRYDGAGCVGPSESNQPMFDEGRLRNALAQLAQGLEALHITGRVHRDIKPTNILVTRDNRVVLLDFGLVTLAEPGLLADGPTDLLLGTPAYMAPEQAAYEDTGPEADWYAVGVILYQALTGSLPFSGSERQVMRDKQLAVPPRPSQIAPRIPEDLDDLCSMLLQPKPSDRPSGARVQRRLQGTRSRLQHITGGGHQRPRLFVGRQQELEVLLEAFERRRLGKPVSVLMHGASGLGKTELLNALVRRMSSSRDQVIVLRGRCYEQDTAPFKAFDDVVFDLSQLLVQMPCEEVAGLVPQNARLMARLFPVLGRVEALDAAPWSRPGVEDLHEVRALAFSALRELLARLAGRHPLVLLIDDLQWADEDSYKLLRTLLNPPEAPAFFLVATLRTPTGEEQAQRALEEAAAVFPSGVERLKIGPLSPDAANKLAAALLEADARSVSSKEGGTSRESSKTHAEKISKEAEGHPLFIHELVYHALERGVTAETLRLDEVLVSRIESLEPPSHALVELVSIAGAPIQQGLVAETIGLRPSEISPLITKLKGANLLRSQGMHMSDTIEPYHDRVREAVLARLSVEQRQIWHGRLAQVLHAMGQAEPEVLARHLEEAGEHAGAARHAANAAARAAEKLAFDQAARLYRKALQLWPAPGDPGAKDDEKRDLWVHLGDVLANAGRGAEAAEAYLQAVPGVRATEALDLKLRAAMQLFISGHVDQGIELAGQVFSALGMRMPRTPIRALLSLIRRRMNLRLRGVEVKHRDTSQISSEDLVRVDICRSLAIGLAVVDNIRGADFSTRWVLSALKAGEPDRVALALATEAAFIAGSGHYHTRYYRKVVNTAETLMLKHENALARAYLVGARAYGAYMAGSWENAKDLAENTLTQIKPIGTSWEYGTMRLIALWSLFYLGELEELTLRATQWAQDALERGDFFTAAGMLMGRPNVIYLKQDDPPRARQEVEQALGQWKTMDYYIQHYHALLALTHVDLYQGRNDQARERLDLEWPRLKRSLLLMLPSVKYEALHLRGRVALAMAGEAEPSKRKRHLSLASKQARRLARRKLAWTSALSLLLQAGVAAQRGNDSDTATKLESAIAALDATQMHLYAAAARRRLGELLGGDEGATHLAAGDAFMNKQGVKDPQRMTAMLAPGFDK